MERFLYNDEEMSDTQRTEKFFYERNSLINQLFWFMTNLSFTIAVVITSAFWICLFPFLDTSTWNFGVWFSNINVHLIQVSFYFHNHSVEVKGYEQP